MPKLRGPHRPNFFVIGTQKAGTTFLCHHLATHEKVAFGKRKELFFFGRGGLNKNAFRTYLKNHFSRRRAKKTATIFVDGTANYYRYPRALKNMERFLGTDFKVAMSMRHPVSKTLSWYMHNYEKNRLNGTESLLTKNLIGHAENAKHLRRWMDALGPERLLVLTYDMLQADPLEFVNSATRFLGIEPITELPAERVNAGSPIVSRGDFLEPMLPEKPAEGKVVPRFSLQEIAELQQLLKQDVLETQAMTGLDLSSWLELPKFKTAEQVVDRLEPPLLDA